MHEAACAKCITDPYVQDHIRRIGTEGDCDFCGTKDTQVTDVEEIVDFLRERIRNEYRPVDEECPPFYREEDSLLRRYIRRPRYLRN